MSPDDFERKPRFGNTHLHKLNPNLNHKKNKNKNQTFGVFGTCFQTTIFNF